MNELNLSDMMRNAVIGVMTVISLALIIKTGVRVLLQKDARYKGIIYMCVIAPVGVIADWFKGFCKKPQSMEETCFCIYRCSFRFAYRQTPLQKQKFVCKISLKEGDKSCFTDKADKYFNPSLFCQAISGILPTKQT